MGDVTDHHTGTGAAHEPLDPTIRDDGFVEDVLGKGFDALTLPLGEDEEGELVATLVRADPTAVEPVSDDLAGRTVLYLHGWSDYFFHRHVAQFLTARGARFFALDLRKYGRSLREGQTAGSVLSLSEYDQDIAAARDVIGPDRLVLCGHSTGGLTAALWAARHPAAVDALVLNSPWLEFHLGAVGRRVAEPLARLGVRALPRRRVLPRGLPFYARTLHARHGGEWEYSLDWKPERGTPLTPGFLTAVLEGQNRVADGLGLERPVLVLCSTASVFSPMFDPAMAESDVVLDVNLMVRRAATLGQHVTIERVAGAPHDVFLGPPAVRGAALDAISRWLSSPVADS